MTAIMRLPSAAYVVQRTLEPDSVKGRNTTNGSWPTAVQIVDDLERAGWHLVPARRPQLRHDQSGTPPLAEGEITTRQLIDCAAAFDEIDEDLFTAADFVAWLVPDVRGTPEYRWLEQRRLR